MPEPTNPPTRVDAAGLRAVAESHGLCPRPILRRLTDTVTGETRVVAIPCQSTKASVCGPCSERARWLRVQQCREGWHLDDEPDAGNEEPPADEETPADDEDQADEPDDEGQGARRVRSTRRRDDVPDLPRVPMTDRTIGKTLTSPTGKTYRPSMFLTVTPVSYGPVRPDGTPVDPKTYEYRQAALDAMHWPKLVDRLWQNFRRCAGFKAQYFAVIESQRRLAPHMHAAVRGILPRSVFEKVVAATYASVWWPPIGEPVYADPDRQPEWDPTAGRDGAYVCPWSGQPLPTWEQALDDLDADAEAGEPVEPFHVLRFGKQTDYQWLIAESGRTDRRVNYLTKYLTKAVAETYDPDKINARQIAHRDRLNHETRWLPCSPECANWLRHGVAPKNAGEGLEAGACPKAAHKPDNVGYGGRRVLVSRQWTGKTLDQHKADRAEVVRQVLTEAGIDMADQHAYAADVQRDDGTPRFIWEEIDTAELDPAIGHMAQLAAIRRKQAWRAQYEAAKNRADPEPDTRSATPTRQETAA